MGLNFSDNQQQTKKKNATYISLRTNRHAILPIEKKRCDKCANQKYFSSKKKKELLLKERTERESWKWEISH